MDEALVYIKLNPATRLFSIDVLIKDEDKGDTELRELLDYLVGAIRKKYPSSDVPLDPSNN